jgi:hypothetical protein
LKDRINYHNEKQQLYILNDNTAAISQNTESIKKIEQELKLNKLMYDFLSVTKKYHQSVLDVNYAELSVKVAELSYEKSKIAAAYIDSKTAPADTSAPSDPKKQKAEKKNPINVNDYQKQLDERKKILADKKTASENLLVELNNSEKKIKYEGFTIDQEFIIK